MAARPAQGPETIERTSAVRSASTYRSQGFIWLILGILPTAAIANFGFAQELYILSIGIAVFGLLQLATARLINSGRTENGFYEVMHDLFHMPPVMKQLSVVQFFSWFALFGMWIYTTPAVTSFHFGSQDTTSSLYNEGADWVGVLFAAYNLFAALIALFIPKVSAKLGRRRTHLLTLSLGGLGLMSFAVIKDPTYLIVSMVGVGIAWASILSVPYSSAFQCCAL